MAFRLVEYRVYLNDRMIKTWRLNARKCIHYIHTLVHKAVKDNKVNSEY